MNLVADDFLELPDGIEIVTASGVAVDSEGRIHVGHRGEFPILTFSSDGTLLRATGNDLIPRREMVVYEPDPGESGVAEYIGPGYVVDSDRVLRARGSIRPLHGVHVDADDNLWITDTGTHVVHKLDPDGEVVLTLGSADRPGTGPDQFDQPTDVTLSRGGDVFVTDGYVNSRVSVFGPAGDHLRSWGQRGPGPGEFNTPHAITVDDDGVLYVSDRTNARIQRFDQSGVHLGDWTDLDLDRPDPGEINDLAWGPDGRLYLGNGRGHRITVLDGDGRFRTSWGGPDRFRVVHGISFDRDGRLHVAEVKGHRVRRFHVG